MAESPAPGAFAFANTIVVPRVEGQTSDLLTIGVVDRPRLKLPHTKSRRGCLARKRRRVKLARVRNPVLSQNQDRMDTEPQISLLQLELFHHWGKQTMSTLTFPQVWPAKDFVMSAILCVAAMHLTTLCSQNHKYSRASMQLTARTVRLFRETLSRPITRDNCEALMGTALLVNYMSWSDLGFLDSPVNGESTAGLDLAHNLLFLLSPGNIQAIPVFFDEGGAFAEMIHQNPRVSIEHELTECGEDTTRFVEPLMWMWDDLCCQSPRPVAVETVPRGPPPHAWRLLLGLERELVLVRSAPRTTGTTPKTAITNVTTDHASTGRLQISAASSSEATQSMRLFFQRIMCRVSPLFSCANLKSAGSTVAKSAVLQVEEAIEQLSYGFPILCCAPLLKLLTLRDSRALVGLVHFYGAAHNLLISERCWSTFREERIAEELNLGRLDAYLII
ncbi:uncharacterized protein B0I36DRAFT_372499 [Microdochium trichocladiopsis]|uniref:C6 transcription factor n=1 Tax=Microdochium trichocladiopsis TaxID=1682393 RepID=A0A9P8YAX5_9PEZI|nr:uncharacterized protein B0I36DRAFT_372499 [Microdochium trichocladiopsis]KAH7034520.1 hypothetical protein B0I36DRAFT_372499 [Microdochium trichocladiopsis]